jgi:hypothetical protein
LAVYDTVSDLLAVPTSGNLFPRAEESQVWRDRMQIRGKIFYDIKMLKTSMYSSSKINFVEPFQFGALLVIPGMAIKFSHTLYIPGN